MLRIDKLRIKYLIFSVIYVLFFIVYFSAITIAKYTTVLNSNGNIDVALWDVYVLGNDNVTLPTITIGDSSTYQDYTFSVTSLSEVGLSYSLILSNVPTGIEVQVDDDEVYSESNSEIIISNLGSFDASDNNSTHNHKLTFIAPLGISTISNETIDLDVIFIQDGI